MSSITSMPTQYARVNRRGFQSNELFATYIFIALFIAATALTIGGAVLTNMAMIITAGLATASLGFAYAIYLIVSIDRSND
ncbi:MAG: hypothetical protein Q4P05_05700 [Actinomycetaceae bacterium]|nr:hypothetical protein [Actinomycetaceae bacterium]